MNCGIFLLSSLCNFVEKNQVNIAVEFITIIRWTPKIFERHYLNQKFNISKCSCFILEFFYLVVVFLFINVLWGWKFILYNQEVFSQVDFGGNKKVLSSIRKAIRQIHDPMFFPWEKFYFLILATVRWGNFGPVVWKGLKHRYKEICNLIFNFKDRFNRYWYKQSIYWIFMAI